MSIATVAISGSAAGFGLVSFAFLGCGRGEVDSPAFFFLRRKKKAFFSRPGRGVGCFLGWASLCSLFYSLLIRFV
jgi:hypothetical protein